MSKRHRFFLYIYLLHKYRGNFNHWESVHHPLSALAVGTWKYGILWQEKEGGLIVRLSPRALGFYKR